MNWRHAALACVTGLALAQQPDIRVTTRLVQVSVLALDNKGNPIEGLTRDDFEVFDKGRPQKIAKFSMEVRQPPPKEQKKPAPGLFTNSKEDPRKAIEAASTILLFDGLNTPWKDQVYAREQMVKFLATLKPGDKVAIYSLGRELRILHELSEDVESLIRIAKGLRGEHSMEISDKGIDTSSIEDKELAAFLDAANKRMEDFFTVNRIRSTLAAIEAIAQHTRKIPGRKNLVWMSASFPIWIGIDQPPFDPETNTMYTGERRSFAEDVERTVRRINDSNIAIYPVDARGLITNPIFQAELSSAAALKSVQKGKSSMQDIHLSQDSMQMIAERTGGKAFLNTNDLEGALRKAIDETRVSYLIGFYPAHDDWSGKWREVKVRAARAGVHLRYRSGYVAYADKPPAKRDIKVDVQEALGSPLESTDLLLGAYLAWEGAPAKALHTTVTLELSSLTLTPKGDRWLGGLEIVYFFVKGGGEKPELITEGLDLNLTKETYLKLQKEGVILRRSFAPPKNLERVKVVLVDKPSGSLGSLSMSAAKLPVL